ncbi:hypothetical protein PDQ70_02045 [Bacillus cereus group sp. Bc011]|nr:MULTISPECIES: hypothetical protein [unclassified Bacillus cereus group]MDA2662180.1 hypothetical protein [Bacillus cereus group sp. Bc032]MDA2672903.1 hypothetical protein [Bacillus cereus group sp. Bc031]MDA2678448.1 hypothetical protein [Bacillus cereus group sp. Bc029]MDA2683957.1 hypothetical protein [Bacillus cereus group sp. Bc030]MDA2739316.1 hypothetical protein [Bacillus cereus group sp. Bc011]
MGNGKRAKGKLKNRRLAFFFICCSLAPAARMFGGFAPSCEAKNASTSGAPSPSHSKRAASALYEIQLQRQALRV